MAKKKIKKALKMAVPIIGAALAGKALMDRRNQNKTYLEEEGGDRSKIVSGPFITRRNRGNTAEMLDFGDAFSYMPGMKKGGRVKGCGIAKRGFGKAMKKRK